MASTSKTSDTEMNVDVSDPRPSKKVKVSHIDPDSKRPDSDRISNRQTLDKALRDNVFSALLACHVGVIQSVGLPTKRLTDIHVSTQVTAAIYTSHTVLRQQANGRGNVKDKVVDRNFTLNYNGLSHETPMSVVIARVEKIMSCFDLIYTKPGPNDSNHWFGVAAPLLSFLSGFKYRFDELRVGQANFSIGKIGDISQMVKLSKWGLNTNHHSLCEGITFPPNKQSSIAQSLGPLTCLIKLTLCTDPTYQQKWINAVMRTCAHIPEIGSICTMIKGRGAFETKGLICAIGNLLLLISGRQAHRAYMPAGLLVHLLLDKADIKYFESHDCKKYPGFKYEHVSKYNFSGLAAFYYYNKISEVSCPSSLGGFAAQIFFHSVWGTYCEDLGLLQWMVTKAGTWADRSEMGNCFKDYGTCDSSMSFDPFKIKFYSKLCSASNTGLLGKREMQTMNGYVFAGKREQKFCTTFLNSIKETSQAAVAVRKDIPSLTKMIQETTNRLLEVIKTKGNVIEMGTVEWKRMPLTLEEEAAVINERCVSTGKYFLGRATEEEFIE